MGGPEGRLTFRGHEGIAEWAKGLGDAWRDITFEPLEIERDEAGRRALVLVRVRTRGRASDMGLERMEAHVVDAGTSGKVDAAARGSPISERPAPPSRPQIRVYDEPRARIAQWIERWPPEPEVAGSNPAARVRAMHPSWEGLRCQVDTRPAAARPPGRGRPGAGVPPKTDAWPKRAQQDSNLRPLAPEASALSTELCALAAHHRPGPEPSKPARASSSVNQAAGSPSRSVRARPHAPPSAPAPCRSPGPSCGPSPRPGRAGPRHPSRSRAARRTSRHASPRPVAHSAIPSYPRKVSGPSGPPMERTSSTSGASSSRVPLVPSFKAA